MASTRFTPDSLIQIDQNCIWHPFTQMKTAKPPVPIVKAKGLYLYDEKGNSYMDAISSWWVNLHGHTHPYIVERIKKQAEELEHVIFADFTHRPAVELAFRLLNILPEGMSKIFYSDNGSTAVEVAIKISLQYWHNQDPKTTKTKVVCFKHSYHGDTLGAMSAAGKNEFNKPFWNQLFEVEQIIPPVRGQEELSLKQLREVLRKNQTACFIFEPLVLGSGGMIIYPPEGLNKLMQSCREHQVLTIADEVMTGFGRTGTLFACEHLSEPPDLMCLSKGITGGFLPLGATVCKEEIYQAFLSDHKQQSFLHGHSYTANPLACSSALASLDLLLDNSCISQRNMIANSHRTFCQRWCSHPKLKRCENLGTILALEYVGEQSSYFQPMRDKLYDFFINKGILLRPLGNVLYILPPYCIKEDELSFIYAQIIETLEGEL